MLVIYTEVLALLLGAYTPIEVLAHVFILPSTNCGRRLGLFSSLRQSILGFQLGNHRDVAAATIALSAGFRAKARIVPHSGEGQTAFTAVKAVL